MKEPDLSKTEKDMNKHTNSQADDTDDIHSEDTSCTSDETRFTLILDHFFPPFEKSRRSPFYLSKHCVLDLASGGGLVRFEGTPTSLYTAFSGFLLFFFSFFVVAFGFASCGKGIYHIRDVV